MQRIILVLLGVMAGSLWALNEDGWVEFSQKLYQSHSSDCSSMDERRPSQNKPLIYAFQSPNSQTTELSLYRKTSYFWYPLVLVIPREAGELRGCVRGNDSLLWVPWDLKTMRFYVDTSSSYLKSRFGKKWATWLPGTLLRRIPEKPEVEQILADFLTNLDPTMVRVTESDLPQFMDIFEKDSAGRVDAFQNWVAPRVIHPTDSTGLYYMDTTGIDAYFQPDVSEKDTAWVMHRLYSYCDGRFTNQIKGLTYRVSRNGVVKIVDERWFLLGQRIRVRKVPPCNQGFSCGG